MVYNSEKLFSMNARALWFLVFVTWIFIIYMEDYLL